jgi:hypothetical protein
VSDTFVPLDLAAALRAGSDWRARYAFPLPHSLSRDFDQPFRIEFLDLIEHETDPFHHDVLLHAAPIVWMMSLGLRELALLIQGAEAMGIPHAGGPPEAKLLAGRIDGETLETTRPTPVFPERIRNALLRRIARTRSWTPYRHLPATLLAPTQTAINHNALLIATAGKARERVLYKHADLFTGDWDTVEPASRVHDELVGRSEAMSALFARDDEHLRPDMASRLAELLRDRIGDALRRSARAMMAMRAVKRFETGIWSGTGGSFAPRAVRIEALRRGKAVTGFDHGGTPAMVDEAFGATLLEFSVATRHVMPTEALVAPMTRWLDANGPRFGGVELVGGDGDPSFEPALRSTGERHSGATRVLNIMSPFVGPWQRIRPRQNDIQKLDWQTSLVETLLSLKIDLICQPHPEGALPGRDHPIQHIAPISGGRFEEAVGWADTVVTDMVLSTTLWRAACINIPVVLIDMDMGDFNPRLRELIQARFRILPVRYGPDNRPELSRDALGAAVFAPLSDNERDAARQFQRLLIGT